MTALDLTHNFIHRLASSSSSSSSPPSPSRQDERSSLKDEMNTKMTDRIDHRQQLPSGGEQKIPDKHQEEEAKAADVSTKSNRTSTRQQQQQRKISRVQHDETAAATAAFVRRKANATSKHTTKTPAATTANKRSYVKKKNKAAPKKNMDINSNNAKKQRQQAARSPRRVIPEFKDYIPENEPKRVDVVSGRGGRSNHHIGNRPYWIKILETRDTYKQCVDDDSKRSIAQSIVDYISDQGGRFVQLELSTDRWFLLPTKVILDKVKQALRDKYVPLWAREEYGFGDDDTTPDNDGNYGKGEQEGEVESKVEDATDEEARPDEAPSSSFSATKAPEVVENCRHNNRSGSSTSASKQINNDGKVQEDDRKPAASKKRSAPRSNKTTPRGRKSVASNKKTKTTATSASKKQSPAVAAATNRKMGSRKNAPPATRIKPSKQEEHIVDGAFVVEGSLPPAVTTTTTTRAAERYDDLYEVIDQNMPALASSPQHDPYGLLVGHSLSLDPQFGFGSFGGLSSGGFVGAGYNPAVASNRSFAMADTALDGNMRSVDMVGNMLGQWEEGDGAVGSSHSSTAGVVAGGTGGGAGSSTATTLDNNPQEGGNTDDASSSCIVPSWADNMFAEAMGAPPKEDTDHQA